MNGGFVVNRYYIVFIVGVALLFGCDRHQSSSESQPSSSQKDENMSSADPVAEYLVVDQVNKNNKTKMALSLKASYITKIHNLANEHLVEIKEHARRVSDADSPIDTQDGQMASLLLEKYASEMIILSEIDNHKNGEKDLIQAKWAFRNYCKLHGDYTCAPLSSENGPYWKAVKKYQARR